MKAILEVEMPNNCAECQFCIDGKHPHATPPTCAAKIGEYGLRKTLLNAADKSKADFCPLRKAYNP